MFEDTNWTFVAGIIAQWVSVILIGLAYSKVDKAISVLRKKYNNESVDSDENKTLNDFSTWFMVGVILALFGFVLLLWGYYGGLQSTIYDNNNHVMKFEEGLSSTLGSLIPWLLALQFIIIIAYIVGLYTISSFVSDSSISGNTIKYLILSMFILFIACHALILGAYLYSTPQSDFSKSAKNLSISAKNKIRSGIGRLGEYALTEEQIANIEKRGYMEKLTEKEKQIANLEQEINNLKQVDAVNPKNVNIDILGPKYTIEDYRKNPYASHNIKPLRIGSKYY